MSWSAHLSSRQNVGTLSLGILSFGRWTHEGPEPLPEEARRRAVEEEVAAEAGDVERVRRVLRHQHTCKSA